MFPWMVILRLFKRLIHWLCLVSIALSILILLIQAIQLRTILFPWQAEGNTLLLLIKYAMLATLELLLPISALISCLITYQQMKAYFFSIQVYGYSLKTLYLPVILFALLMGTLQLKLSCTLTPWALKSLRPILVTMLENRFNHHQISFPLQTQGFSGTALIYEGIDQQRYFFVILADHQGQLIAQNPSLALRLDHLDQKESTLMIKLQQVVFQHRQFKANIDELSLEAALDLKLKQFSPPNSSLQSELKNTPHERFIYHRRIVQALSTMVWLILAVSLQLIQRLIPIQQALLFTTSILGFYSLMRFLELKARALSFPPEWAAWLPFCLLLLLLFWVYRYVNKLLHS